MAKSATISAPKKPAELIDATTPIESRDQLPFYLKWIAWLRSTVSSVDAREQNEHRAITEANDKKRKLKVGKVQVPMKEYAAQLEEAVIDFARDHHDELFSEKVKTIELEGGAISSRIQPEKVGFIVDGADEDEVVKEIIVAADLLAALDTLRADVACAFPFLRVDVSLDRAGIVNAYRARTLIDEDLAKRGLKIIRDPVKYAVKTT